VRIVVRLVLAALVVGIAALAALLLEAHWEIRHVDPPLPERAALDALAREADGPVRISYVLTASQSGPTGPGRSGPVGHPAFLIEWADGRAFLVDTGMDREQAVAFGRPMELLLDADPAEAFGSVAEQLGPAGDAIEAVAFTHLHVDHTGGIVSLCAARGRPLDVFQTSWQAERGNFTTYGREDVERAGCARLRRAEGGPLYRFPGFPGLAAAAAGGHTPGSTVYFARVGDHTWVLSGDVTNFKAPLLENQPKPRVYSLLVVPESPGRLEKMRTWLAALDRDPAYSVVPSHDRDALEQSGMPRR